jgi:hypothetical protein
MSQPEYPSEPVPPREKLLDSVGKLFQEIGAASLTRRVLTKRLEQEYKINFAPHRKMLDELVMQKIQEPELQLEVAKAAVAHHEGPKGGTKKKGDKADKGSKKEKHEKAEGEPNRPQSAFFFFSNEKRPALMDEARADGGKVNVAEIGKKIGELWKAVSEEDRATYKVKADADKQRYESEKAAWIANGGGGKKAQAAKAKAEGPKRPTNALFLYMNDNREAYKKEHPEAKLTDTTKALAERFKSLPQNERKVYDDKYAADKARYDAEVAALKN